MAAFRKRNKWGFMNKTGKPVIKEQYDAVFAFDDGKARVKWNGKWGLIGKDGKYLLPAQYDDIELAKSNYIVSKEGKFGLFSDTLEQIFACTLDDIHFSREKDILEITEGGKMFLYNLAENKTIWEETLLSENPK
jgi:exopolysaccharide biosynthesis protein